MCRGKWSLGDVRMNLEVIECCATVLLLEPSLPDQLLASEEPSWEISHSSTIMSEGCSSSGFLTHYVNIAKITAFLIPFCYRGSRSIIVRILHDACLLKLHCTDLKVRFGISKKFVDQAGRPKLSFVVDAPSNVCQILDACDYHALNLFMESGTTSDWRPAVTRNSGYFPTIRLRIPAIVIGDTATYGTEIIQKETSSGAEQKLVFSKFDATEFEILFTAGSFVDAFFSLDTYDYLQNAGIRLVAEKLVIHSKSD